MSSSRPDHFSLGYSSQQHHPGQPRSTSPSTNNSPIDPSVRPSFGLTGGVSSPSMMSGNPRSGTGSPSELGASSRLFSKRAREIQAQEGIQGMPLNLWGGPPTSGNSTPLRENIPESPTDGFPDFVALPTPDSGPQTRRARAGTLPSRFSPGGPTASHSGAKSARHTPSQTPYTNSPSPGLEPIDNPTSSSTLLSRLRAGSLPQRSQFAPLPGTASPFGPSIFSSWNPVGTGRERGQTLASIASVPSNNPSSPSQSQFSREDGNESNVHMRTLDYLGLAETPQQTRAQLATPYIPSMEMMRQANRFRSYSVNNKELHAGEYPADDEDGYDAAAALQDELAATQAAIHNHNLAVQAFVKQAARPRAATAGVLDKPNSRLMNNYFSTSTSNVPSSLGRGDSRMLDEQDFDDLPRSVAGLNLGRSNSYNAGLLSPDEGLEGPTSALWLGNIPTSTTTSTLTEMFKSHGPIISVRVLTHKNCGFVNFQRIESAVSAKANMNGKEIFPGASPIRINFAKPASPGNTPGHDGVYPSPSPVPFPKSQDVAPESSSASFEAANPPALPAIPALHEIGDEIIEVASQFGPSDDDGVRLSHSVQSAVQFNEFYDEIPAVGEPTHSRMHDAPKLREIRKRIDNGSYSIADIENVAMEMLPEIAELSSDYLGNTVVQKLFESCSEQIRDAMLAEIAPHIAEIGVHKNGTWAAQKIIDVCNTPSQMSMLAENIRPYTVPLFLDQYGNYVLQGCLKFGPPFNDFIFETMLGHLGPLAQGRYGARAMRACLESHHASKDQQRMVAASIVVQGVHLATNANGALLLTWYLDTCTFPQRRAILAPRLLPYLVHLGTHKIAYLTVLKLINQKAEPDARDMILRALFFSHNDQVLEAILADQQCGVTLIFKVLTTPFFDEAIRGKVVDNVRNVLVRIKAQPNQGYKRLMDEVGLTTRPSGPSRESSQSEQRTRPSSRHANTNGHQGQQNAGPNKAYYGSMNGPAQTGYDMSYGSSRNDTPDSNGMSSFPQFNQGAMYNSSNGSMPPGMKMQQMQYQQSMMSRGNPQMGYNFPPMQTGYGSFPGGNPPSDQFRQNMSSNSSPMPPSSSHGGQAGFAPPPGFGMGAGTNYGYGQMGGMPNMNQSTSHMSQDQGNSNRRGRSRGGQQQYYK